MDRVNVGCGMCYVGCRMWHVGRWECRNVRVGYEMWDVRSGM